MKLLLVLAVVLLVLWLLRSTRRDDSPPPEPPPPGPKEVVRCGLCQLHLPRDEALVGRHGLYCCAEHQRLAEPQG